MADIPDVTSTDPVELLAAGRRSLAVKDYPSAVTNLGKACELLVNKFGDRADECGEVYLWYGKALLGLSREESGVLGDGLPGQEGADEDDGEDDAKADGSDDNNDDDNKEGEEEKQEKGIDEPSTESVAGSIVKNGQEQGGEILSSTNTEPGGSASANGVEDDDEEVGDEDDVENLQIAWETLELARAILSKRIDNSDEAAKALLAEVHLLLGEVALESETYDKAVIDMEKCLQLQKELYCSDDRRIAETHYQIGLANSLASNFEESVLHFKNAANILLARIHTLESGDAASNDPTVRKYSAADPFYSVAGEIKELKELLPEIQEKIQDMMEYKAEAIKAVRAQLCPSTNGDGPSTSFSAPSSSSLSQAAPKQQASDISHLIKRKRKSSQSDEAPANDADNPPKRPNV